MKFSRSQTTWSLPFKFASVVPICMIYGGLNPFCDISHGHGTIPLSLDRVLDQVCRCLRSQKSFLEKNINKVSKYCVIFFWIIFLDSTLLICQKYRIIISLQELQDGLQLPLLHDGCVEHHCDGCVLIFFTNSYLSWSHML